MSVPPVIVHRASGGVGLSTVFGAGTKSHRASHPLSLCGVCVTRAAAKTIQTQSSVSVVVAFLLSCGILEAEVVRNNRDQTRLPKELLKAFASHLGRDIMQKWR